MLLTTQVSSTIQIGCNNEKKTLVRGMYEVKFIKQPNRITKEDIPLLQILDSIRLIKEIPDTNVNRSCKRIIQIIKELPKEKLNLLKKLVLKYNASTRALTGAIIEVIVGNKESQTILKSLNPATSYKFSISEQVLPNKEKWNIK